MPPSSSSSKYQHHLNSTPNKQMKSSDIDSIMPSPYRRVHTDLENLLVHDDYNLPKTSNTNSLFEEGDGIHHHHHQQYHLRSKNNTNNHPNSMESGKEYPKTPTKTLWVGNLEKVIDKTLLYKIFGKFGTICSIRLVLNKKCAFINYEKIENASMAKNSLNESDVGGNSVIIKYSSPISSDGTNSINFLTTNSNTSNTTFSSSDFINELQQQNSVWIGQLGDDVSREALLEKFSLYGNIESFKILEGKGCAFINFSSNEDANRARKEMMGKKIANSVIRTGYCKCNSSFTIDGSGGSGGSSTSLLNDNTKSTLYTKNILSIRDLYKENGDVISQDLQNEMREWKKYLKQRDPQEGQFSNWVSENLMSSISLACIDPIGNVIVQRAVEVVNIYTLEEIIKSILKWIPTIGIHKNGTWAMQKILKVISEQRSQEGIKLQIMVSEAIKPYIVALMHDQYGNYVIQGCLSFKENQFIFDAFYHESPLISSNRFGSRGMRSCLESEFVTQSQRKYVTMALLNYSGILVNDFNSCIVLNWMLDSIEDLPSCAKYLTTILKNEFLNMATGSKPKIALLMKIVNSASNDEMIRNEIVEKLFPQTSSSSLIEEYSTILKDESSSQMILHLLMMCDLSDRIRISNKISPVLEGINETHLEELKRMVLVVRNTIDIDDTLTIDFNLPSKRSSNAVGGPRNTDINFESTKKNNFPEMSPTIKARIDLKDLMLSSSSSSLMVIDFTTQKESFGPGLLGKEEE